MESARKTRNLIKKNLPDTCMLSQYLSRSAQEIADEIARNLVERALENDRRKLIQRQKDPSLPGCPEEDQLVLENFVEVASNR